MNGPKYYQDNIVYIFTNDGLRNPCECYTFDDDDDKDVVCAEIKDLCLKVREKHPYAKIMIRIYANCINGTFKE